MIALSMVGIAAGELEIIGAGFGRTGTLSLKVALDKLGYKTYHMEEIIQRKNDHVALWTKVATANKKERIELIRQIYADYTAAVDFPASGFWEDTLEAFPNAKVIFTQRDAEAWYKSASSTILSIGVAWQFDIVRFLSPLFREHKQMAEIAIWKKVWGLNTEEIADPKNKDRVIAKYNEWSNDVETRNWKVEQFLTLKIDKNSWPKLCSFLKVSKAKCPTDEFPKVNDNAGFKLFLFSITAGLFIVPIVGMIVLVFGIRFALRRFGKSNPKKHS